MFKREPLVTNCEKKFLVKALSEWTRLDGRSFNEFRPIQIDFGKDWGCCSVSLGKTRVLGQVTCEIQEPKSSRPSEGILNVNIELNPIAAPHFEAGRQSDQCVQLNRLLEKCLKDSKAVDLESLCIQTHEKVWALRVDVNVLNHEGNILDCASVAALAALAHFKRPDVTSDGEEFIIHSYKERDPLPMVIHHYPVYVTYAIFNGGEFIVADPSLIEEGIADAHLSVGLNAYKELCGLHLGGNAELTPDVILATTTKAAGRATIVVDLIKKALSDDHSSRQNKDCVIRLSDKIHVDRTVIADLEECLLEQWSKRKEKKNRSREDDDGNKEAMAGAIQVLGKNSAGFIPEEYVKAASEESDQSEDPEDDDDVVYVELPKEQAMEITDSDSEEENVVVLNADKQTNKKKK